MCEIAPIVLCKKLLLDNLHQYILAVFLFSYNTVLIILFRVFSYCRVVKNNAKANQRHVNTHVTNTDDKCKFQTRQASTL